MPADDHDPTNPELVEHIVLGNRNSFILMCDPGATMVGASIRRALWEREAAGLH